MDSSRASGRKLRVASSRLQTPLSGASQPLIQTHNSETGDGASSDAHMHMHMHMHLPLLLACCPHFVARAKHDHGASEIGEEMISKQETSKTTLQYKVV